MKSVELFITGKKAIDVGYRPFLLLNALKQGILEYECIQYHRRGV